VFGFHSGVKPSTGNTSEDVVVLFLADGVCVCENTQFSAANE